MSKSFWLHPWHDELSPPPTLLRLQPRHDDSEENVKARLELWDVHLQHLRAAYEDVSLRLEANTDAVEEPFEQAVEFLTLEARLPDIEVVESHTLKQFQYEIIDTMRWDRPQGPPCLWDCPTPALNSFFSLPCTLFQYL